MNPAVILALISNLYEQLEAAQREAAALRAQVSELLGGSQDGQP